MTRRGRVALGSALLVMALGCGFGVEDTDGTDTEEVFEGDPPFVAPEILGPEPAFALVRPGETATFEWRVVWPGGERPAYEAFRIGARIPSLDAAAPVRGGWVEGRSVYRAELTTDARGAYEIPLEPEICVRSHCQAVDATAAHARVAGGPADVVFPAVAALSLAVGEVRPFIAYPATAPVPNLNPDVYPLRSWSDDPLGYAVDDGAVASVSADGVITGVSTGDTLLHITAGEAATEVAITVVDAPLAPPGEGRWPVIDYRIDLLEAPVYGRGVREAKVAVDPRGWPRLAAPFHPGRGASLSEKSFVDLPPMVLTRWTGTGFGYEFLGEPWESNGQPVLAIGSDGHEWMMLRNELFDRLELWDRPADAAPGSWTKRRLPTGPDVGLGEVDVSVFRPGLEFHDWNEPLVSGVWAGDDGRVAFGYATTADYKNPYSAIPYYESCPKMRFLAEAGPDGVEVTRIKQLWTFSTPQQAFDGDCETTERTYARIVVLPPSLGSPHPGMVFLGGEEDPVEFGPDPGGLWAWRWTPDGWDASYLEGTEGIQDLAPVLPVRDAVDWFSTSTGPVPLWLWYDVTGAIRSDPPLPGDYAGHGVSEDFVYLFSDDGLDTEDRDLWMTGWSRSLPRP